MKNILLITLLFASYLNTSAQIAHFVSTEELKSNLEKLIKINLNKNGGVDLSGKESVNIEDNATVAQVMEITIPYLNSTITNAKRICYFALCTALDKKAESEIQKQQIVELLCKNYFDNEFDIQQLNHFFIYIRLQEKDFNANARKYITALIDFLPKLGCGVCAQLLSLAQIKESIPILWKIAKKHGQTVYKSDLDVLASLARMNESAAATLLCNYYDSTRAGELNIPVKDTNDMYRHVFFAENLAFSLDSTVLNCLVADFKSISLKYYVRGNDYFWWPSYYLGERIAAMLKNYPYKKKDYNFDPRELMPWLNETCEPVLEDK